MTKPTQEVIKEEQKIGFWKKQCPEWELVVSAIVKPLSLIPVVLGITCLVLANTALTDKMISVLLNLLGALSLSFAGNFVFDFYKTVTGKTLLMKKGLSATRNLDSVRIKSRTIMERVGAGAAGDEIINLLQFFEKDISNAIMEWTDIIPEIESRERENALLKEKELELEAAKKEQNELQKALREQESGSKEDKELLKKLQDESSQKDVRIQSLQNQVATLRASTSMPLSGIPAGSSWGLHPASTTSLLGSRPVLNPLPATLFVPQSDICPRCGKPYPVGLTFHPGDNCSCGKSGGGSP